MDLCADQLLAHLPGTALTATDLETPFVRLFQRSPVVGRTNAAFNVDRLVNRHLTLPRFLRTRAREFDLFHIVDHSYAHATLALPPGRAGVYCHDLDAFRSLLEPAREPRPWWFRRLARRTLRGMQAAAVVFHNSREVGRQLTDAGLVPAEKLVHAPLGVAHEFAPDGGSVELPAPGLPPEPFLLHVGSHIPRKRIDVLLDVFAAVLKRHPDVRLVQVGPPWARAFADQIERLGTAGRIVRFAGLSREQLAELYRRASVVLVPSAAEGFGLPVIEALACGAAVVASDIPVLREVGGEAVAYRPVADVPAWAEAVSRVLNGTGFAPPREDRLARAALYSWREHARVIADAYLRLAGGG
ncbi:glycosyltransferase family 4 protein [Gemmata obscuriglobus]|uniref:Glycosyltransferase family 1 protein n=1 Tax=Gemmata obscuriglobus TaxID=114 RepID=A0A2Z3H7T7_9BACT|nr:glycosyltransferase family 1 protein [Gemmata obscuriglobus]AWM39597.1 glycosyltransferase family 1 protein [Gemmata obscuriglobus]